MKEVIEIYKKIMENKRYRAAGILFIYFIFFVFVFLLLSSGNNSKPQLTGLEKFKTTINYEYIYEGDNNYKTQIKGGKTTSNYYANVYTPSNIYKLINSGVLQSTNYIENSNTYEVKISELEKLYNNEITGDEIFTITTYKENNNIIKVVVDLMNYSGYKIIIEI